MNNIDKIKHYVKVIKRATQLIEELVDQEEDVSIDEFLRNSNSSLRQEPVTSQPVRVQEPVFQEVIQQTPVVKETSTVKTMQPPKPVLKVEDDHVLARRKHVNDLLSIEEWPVAVEKHLEAAATDEDQINRANAVLDMMIDKPIEGSNFLDFGCGDGWVARQALQRGAAYSTGYDLIASNNWGRGSKVQFTNVFKNISEQKYDMIMLYDVLDHCQDPEGVMKQLRSIVKSNGTIYIRCHPWTSKHASHLYKKGLNKAYIHLFLSWEELVESGYTPEFTRQETDPQSAYKWWFESNGFHISSEKFHKSSVSEFFFNTDFEQLIIDEQKLEKDDVDQFFSDMEIDFIDYRIKPA